jgi:hypothetical protein
MLKWTRIYTTAIDSQKIGKPNDLKSLWKQANVWTTGFTNLAKAMPWYNWDIVDRA